MTLIELLVGLVIMSIVSTMILMTWFSLNQSYTFAVSSNVARDNARQMVARMERELRDTQQPATVVEAGIVRARTYWVQFYTTFNELGNGVVTPSPSPTSVGVYSLNPHLVMYRLYKDGTLWRFEDTNLDGTILNVNLNPAVDTPAGFNTNEETTGEGASLLLRSVVNFSLSSPVELFKYGYYDDSGHLQFDTERLGTDNRSGIVAVQIHLLEDLNPKRAPFYADLVTTAQIRNQR